MKSYNIIDLDGYPNRFLSLLGLVAFIGINLLLPSYFNGFSGEVIRFQSFADLVDNPGAHASLELRQTHPAFAKRIVLTAPLDFLTNRLGFPLQATFTFINLMALLGCCLLLMRLSTAWYHARGDARFVGVWMFLWSLPVLFAFTGFTSSYDDFLQYATILGMFLAHHRKQWGLTAALFTLGLLIRETSIIFALPLLVRGNGLAHYQRIFLIGLPILVFGGIFLVIGDNVAAESYLLNDRFDHLRINVGTIRNTILTLFTMLLVLVLPILGCLRQKDSNFRAKTILLLIAINTLLVFFTAIVKESRLIFLPCLLFLPGAFQSFGFRPVFPSWWDFLKLVAIGLLVFFIFIPNEGSSTPFYQLYAAVAFLFLLNPKWYNPPQSVDS